MWHVSSRSSVATLRTAIHLLLTYYRSAAATTATLCLQSDRPVHQLSTPMKNTWIVLSDSGTVSVHGLKTFLFSQAFCLSSGPSAAEVTTLWHFTNLFIDTAHTVYTSASVRHPSICLFIRLSVPAWAHSSIPAVAQGLLLWAQ